MNKKRSDYDSPEAVRIRNNRRLDSIAGQYKDRFHMATSPFENLYAPETLKEIDAHLGHLLTTDD